MKERELTGNKMFEMVKEECERSLGNIQRPEPEQNKGKKNVVMYLGIRSGKVGWYEEKWEGLVSKDKKDFGKYEGEIKFGLPNGEGLFTTTDGKKYIGEWKDGRPWDGIGYKKNEEIEFRVVDGKRYVGTKVREKNDQKTINFTNGDRYVGELKDDKFHGQGTYTWSDGSKYVGGYKNGGMWVGLHYNKEGYVIGVEVNERLEVEMNRRVDDIENKKVLYKRKVNKEWRWYKSGDDKKDDKYSGEVENGVPNGIGKLTDSYGGTHVGEWKDGEESGIGIRTWGNNGEKYIGEFSNGILMKGILYDKNGKITGRTY